MSIASRSILRRGIVKPVRVLVTPTITATPDYTAADNIGGKLTLAGVSSKDGGPVVLDEVKLVDAANQKPTLEIVFFNADPSATTFTDNGALTIHADDVPKIIGKIAIASGDWASAGVKGVADVRNIGMLLVPATGNTLYATMQISGGGLNFAAADDLDLTFVFYPAA